jgi:hypothetical protein
MVWFILFPGKQMIKENELRDSEYTLADIPEI